MIEGFNIEAQVGALASIEMEPERHDQEAWSRAEMDVDLFRMQTGENEWGILDDLEVDASCETARCNAGWLLHNRNIGMNWRLEDIDEDRGVVRLTAMNTHDGRKIEDVAAQILGVENAHDFDYVEADCLPRLFRQQNSLDDLYSLSADYAGISEEDVRLMVKREVEQREANLPVVKR